ncbi:MAG: adenylate/guanylate cyclase domain-containing protein [Acidimicrobiales bacterium]
MTSSATNAEAEPVSQSGEPPQLGGGALPASEWANARGGDGTEHPDELPVGNSHLYIDRTFCFVDLSGFTAFTRAEGPDSAVELLGEFRRITRNIAAKRGVRVAKWLGDGAMLVCTEPEPAVALAVDLVHRFADSDIEVRAGLATGTALLFEGDDYIGEPVNLASRLCSVAGPGEVLADIELATLPDWIEAEGEVACTLRGLGTIGGISKLRPSL